MFEAMWKKITLRCRRDAENRGARYIIRRLAPVMVAMLDQVFFHS